ncbi:MAG: hypothetical protein CL943_00695 [Candidatus Diapherotrites archaeon]|uniref:Flippase-like domain-containing protein n=1 Tax=Candidatus Iainarchaeum sp. TaxID=3101447 RepID=A0A2D6M090_9ARCH|nr:hypothetical protein [Candidatus Diapherotrites archaeon]|tara:strand:+ start:6729 stop:7676 length:948 start_codon:yes stop_codon:yes gene_type:complete
MKKTVFSILGLLLFLYILYTVGIEAIIGSLLGLDLLIFSSALVLLIPSLFLKGLKQKILLKPFESASSLVENTKIWLIGFFFGTASPAKSGDTVRALYLKDSFSISLGQGLATVFLERIFDLVFLFAFAFMGVVMLGLPAGITNTIFVSLVAFFAIFVVVILVMLNKSLVRIVIRPFFNFFAPEKFKASLKEGFNDFYEAVFSYSVHKKVSFSAGLLTAISWLIVFGQFYLLAIALSINISFASFILVLPIILLVEALPISFGGLGAREAAAILMLSFLGVGAAAATSFSLTVLLFNIIQAAIGFLLFNSMKKPI